MKKVKIKAKGKDLSARSFAGSFWTEGFRRKGVDEVIIEVEGDDEMILLDWKLPRTRYNNEEDAKEFNDYVAEKRREGWEFCASWGYGMFKKFTHPNE